MNEETAQSADPEPAASESAVLPQAQIDPSVGSLLEPEHLAAPADAAEPLLQADPPRGLAPSPGLAPSAGLTAPRDFAPPEGFGMPQGFAPPEGMPGIPEGVHPDAFAAPPGESGSGAAPDGAPAVPVPPELPEAPPAPAADEPAVTEPPPPPDLSAGVPQQFASTVFPEQTVPERVERRFQQAFPDQAAQVQQARERAEQVAQEQIRQYVPEQFQAQTQERLQQFLPQQVQQSSFPQQAGQPQSGRPPFPQASAAAASSGAAARTSGSAGRTLRTVLWIGGGILVLIVAWAVIGAIGAAAGSTPDAAATGAARDASEVPVSASDTVTRFLEALAAGDASTARDLAGGDGTDALLTDDVLAYSLELAPITGIEVAPEEDDEDSFQQTVTATFDLGAETVTRDFRVWRSGDDWTIADGLVELSLTGFDGLGATVNGIDPRDDFPLVFPGSYHVAFEVDAFEIDGGEDVFTVAIADDGYSLSDAEVVLTDAATAEFRTLVGDSARACLAMSSLVTPCGLDVSGPFDNGERPIDGTVAHTLTDAGEAALAEIEPVVRAGDPPIVTTYDYFPVSTRLEADLNGEIVSGELLYGGEFLAPSVDFTQDDPAVVWE